MDHRDKPGDDDRVRVDTSSKRTIPFPRDDRLRVLQNNVPPKTEVCKAVMEASDGYERGWAKMLRAAGIEVRVVDPKRVRSFARSARRLANNDAWGRTALILPLICTPRQSAALRRIGTTGKSAPDSHFTKRRNPLKNRVRRKKTQKTPRKTV